MSDGGLGRRLATGGIVLALVALLVVLVASGEADYEVRAEFTNASQLVTGNQVVVGGVAVGSISDIHLSPRGDALITFSVDEEWAPLRRGTTATIRTTSLSSVAGRQIELVLPLEEEAGEEIPSGGVLTGEETTAAVDLDQLFNTLDRRTVRDFKRVIQGFERSYEGVAENANEGYRYMNALFTAGRDVFDELTDDERSLEQLLVNASRFSGALANRAPDVSQMVGNVNRMMNALGDRRTELATAISQLPGFMQNANTTFVNLRAALDDLDPLVESARPLARELLPFLQELRQTTRDSVPTVRDFARVVRRPGAFNDLVSLQELQPALRERAIGTGFPDCGPGPENPEDLQVAADGDFTQGAFGEAICSLTNGLNNLSFFRAYAPELVGWFDGFSHSGYIDAIGPVGRIGTTLNAFSPSFPLVPNLGEILSPIELFEGLQTGMTRRCPGSKERPIDDLGPGQSSVPFTDEGRLTDGSPGSCDPTHLPPGQ